MLLVFVERCRADRAQLTSRQSRFEHVGSIHCALRGARADQGVELVDEQDDLPFGFGNLFQDRFQAVFKFTTVFRSRHERRQVQRHEALGLQHVGHIARNDPLRQALHNGGFPDAGLADQHGIVFCAAGENLHHAANLFVAPNHRIQLLPPRQFGKIARVFFQRRVSSLGILRSHALRSAHSRQGLENRFV